jgi:hypothetical protein
MAVINMQATAELLEAVFSMRSVQRLYNEYTQYYIVQAKPSAWGYNLATLFLGDINTGTWSSSLKSETVKCGHEPRGTRA